MRRRYRGCFRILKCNAVCCNQLLSVLQCVAIHQLLKQITHEYCRVLQCVAECCRVILCVSASKPLAIKNICEHNRLTQNVRAENLVHICIATHCNALQHTATHCHALPHTKTQCNPMQHTATYGNTPQHTASCCSTLSCVLQLAAAHCLVRLNLNPHDANMEHVHTATHLQHTVVHCNTLQHTAMCYIRYITLPDTATYRFTLSHTNKLPHNATICNTLQHTVLCTPLSLCGGFSN